MAKYVSWEAVRTEFERYGANDDALDVIDAIPAADVVERKKGMWERNKNNGLLYCPFCDSVAPAEDQHGEMIFRPPQENPDEA